MPGRQHLFIPGPTNIPDRILRAMHQGSIDHRSATFPELVLPLLDGVRRLFATETGSVALFPASGTGGWEAALTNTLAPGATVLLPCAGQFATLWGDTARRLGYQVVALDDMAWGDAPSAARIADTLRADRERVIRAVLIVHNETSTGVTADLPAIRSAIDRAGHDAMLMADGVSSIASIAYEHDAWGIDVAVTGSQKGLMLPAGLALLAFSPRAVAAAPDGPRAYFYLAPMLAQNKLGYFPYTPPVPLLFGLRESLAMLDEEGKSAIVSRHHRLANGVRAAVAAWGLSICCRDAAAVSDTVTTILTPEQIDGAALIRHAFQRYDLALGAGLGPLSGKAFRIGHLGDLNEGMLLGALGLVEMVLADMGVAVTPGSGVAAAQRRWREAA